MFFKNFFKKYGKAILQAILNIVVAGGAGYGGAVVHQSQSVQEPVEISVDVDAVDSIAVKPDTLKAE